MNEHEMKRLQADEMHEWEGEETPLDIVETQGETLFGETYISLRYDPDDLSLDVDKVFIFKDRITVRFPHRTVDFKGFYARLALLQRAAQIMGGA